VLDICIIQVNYILERDICIIQVNYILERCWQIALGRTYLGKPL